MEVRHLGSEARLNRFVLAKHGMTYEAAEFIYSGGKSRDRRTVLYEVGLARA